MCLHFIFNYQFFKSEFEKRRKALSIVLIDIISSCNIHSNRFIDFFILYNTFSTVRYFPRRNKYSGFHSRHS